MIIGFECVPGPALVHNKQAIPTLESSQRVTAGRKKIKPRALTVASPQHVAFNASKITAIKAVSMQSAEHVTLLPVKPVAVRNNQISSPESVSVTRTKNPPTKFIAVGIDTNYWGSNVQITTDGINWTRIDDENLNPDFPTPAAGVAANLQDVCSNGSRWVAVGWDDNNVVSQAGLVVTSDDEGHHWTVRSNPLSSSTSQMNAVCWDGTNFIAVGFDGNVTPRVMTSPDGITWTTRTSAPSTNVRWFGISTFNGGVIAVGNLTGGGVGVMTSSNHGVTWTQRTPSVVSSTYMGVADDGQTSNTIVAVSQPSSSTTRLMSSTDDGVNWTARTAAPSTPNFGLWDVAWTGSVFVAVGGDENASPVEPHIMTSPTGVTWTQRTPVGVGVDSLLFRRVAVANDGQVVAVGHDGGYVLPNIQGSSNGTTGWTKLTPDPNFADVGPFFGIGARI